MLDLTVEIQEFQFDKHYDITAHLQQCIIDISPDLARRLWLAIENRVLGWQGGHQTSRGACPVPGYS